MRKLLYLDKTEFLRYSKKQKIGRGLDKIEKKVYNVNKMGKGIFFTFSLYERLEKHYSNDETKGSRDEKRQ